MQILSVLFKLQFWNLLNLTFQEILLLGGGIILVRSQLLDGKFNQHFDSEITFDIRYVNIHTMNFKISSELINQEPVCIFTLSTPGESSYQIIGFGLQSYELARISFG